MTPLGSRRTKGKGPVMPKTVGALYDQPMRDLHDAFKYIEPYVPPEDLEKFVEAVDALIRKRIEQREELNRE